MKNKKGAKQQRFIQQVEKQVKTGGVPPRKLQDENQKKLEKEKKEQEKKEMSLLFRPVVTQKVEKGSTYIKIQLSNFIGKFILFINLTHITVNSL